MKQFKGFAASIILLSTSVGAAHTQDADIKNDLERSFTQSQDSQKARLFDSYFYYEVEREGEEIDVSAFSIANSFQGKVGDYAKVVELFNASFGKANKLFSRSTSYQDSLKLLSEQASSLTTDQKLLFLSFAGSHLSSLYSKTLKNQQSPENLFRNSQKGGSEGGICGDIHQYLAGQAKALGFVDVGIHTGIWQKDVKGAISGGHYIYHFKNPETGEYYIQNYSQVINTGQKTQHNMLEVSQRVLGPLVGSMYVQGVKSSYHAYVPQTSLWVKQGLKGLAYASDKSNSVLQLRIGNESQSMGLQVTKKMASGSYLKAFALHQEHMSDEGVYSFSGTGVAGSTDVKFANDVIVNEFGLSARGFSGVGVVHAPTLNSQMEWKEKERNVFFYNMQVTGTARIDKITGKIEIEKTILDQNLRGKNDLSIPENSFRTGFKYSGKNITIENERAFREVKKGHGSLGREWVTEYEKVSLVFDKEYEKVYLVVQGEIYLFEGIEKMAATAVKNVVAASFPVAQLGEVYVAMDFGKVIANENNDPFYDIPASTTFKLGLQRDMNRFMQTGTELSYGKGRRVYPLYNSSSHPSLQSENMPSGFGGKVWMRLRW